MKFSSQKVVIMILRYQNKILICNENREYFKNLWEFPGGKVESDENLYEAALRETKEEVNISLNNLITQGYYQFSSIKHKNLLIHSFFVKLNKEQFAEFMLKEGQKCKWVDQNKLINYPYLAGTYGAIHRFLLSDYYMITREPDGDLAELLLFWQEQFEKGVYIIQLRAKKIAKKSIYELAKKLKELARAYQGYVFINSEIEIAQELKLGIHLTSKQLLKTKKRMLSRKYLISTSCHNKYEFDLAKKFTDIALISPVKKSHYSKRPLISPQDLINFSDSHLVTYALSGLRKKDTAWAQTQGFHGIAGISAFEAN